MTDSRHLRGPLRTVKRALGEAMSALQLAQFELERVEAETAVHVKVGLLLARGGSWGDCAPLYGYPQTRQGAEAARQRFLRLRK